MTIEVMKMLDHFLNHHEVMTVFKAVFTISFSSDFQLAVFNFHYTDETDAAIEEGKEFEMQGLDLEKVVLFGAKMELKKYLNLDVHQLAGFYSSIFNEALKQFKINEVGEA